MRRKRPLRHYAYLSTPVWGWVASRARRKGAASAGSYKNGAPYFQRAPSSIYHLPFTIFSGPLPPLSWSPSPRQAVGGKIKEKKATPPLCLLVHPPVWGWVASGARRKGAASAGSYKNGAPYFQRAPSSIYHLPFTIYHFQRPPSTTIVVPLPPSSRGSFYLFPYIFL